MSATAVRTARATVDSLEAGVAVLDVEGHTVRVPLELLPEGLEEGAGLRLTFAADPSVAEELAREVQARLAALRAKG